MRTLKRHSCFLTKMLFLTLVVLATSLGCVYYNTFYNGKKAFNEAEAAYEKSRKRGDTRRGVASGQYRTAIEKALKVIERYPDSKYVDDALYVLAISYFRLEEYSKAERRCRELLAAYPESEFAPKVTLPYAQAKLALGAEVEAMTLFEDLFQEKYSKEIKAEAALALGDFYAEQDEPDRAISYFRAVRDSLGDGQQEVRAQRSIADVQFDNYQFGDALSAYLLLLGLDPSPEDEFLSLFRAAESSFRLLRIDDGLAYLDRLAHDDKFFDSLGVVKIKMSEGFEMSEDLAAAEATYREIIDEVSKRLLVAEAWYRLGLVYQYDYDDLATAKEYYDKAVEANRASEWGTLALQKSTDIGKLEEYSKVATLDTSATEERVVAAARTQYQLSELYWFQLNKPDSAISEMEYLTQAFQETDYAPRGMIALAEMYKEHLLDTAAADSVLKSMLQLYPHSDHAPDALERLGLKGSAADTGYAQLYMHRAEEFLFEEENVDSARFYYQYVIEHFPDSDHYLQAEFSLLYMQELYELPGDSSLIFAYEEFIDSFPETEWSRLAAQRIGQGHVPQAATLAQADDQERDETRFAVEGDTTLLAAQDQTEEQFGSTAADFELWKYLRPNGDTVVEYTQDPVLIEEPFDFPTEAYSMEQDQLLLYFHILLDFSGKVIEYDLRYPSEYEQLNVNASRTIVSMTFDALEVSRLVDLYTLPPDPSGMGHWFLYKYIVEKPEVLR